MEGLLILIMFYGLGAIIQKVVAHKNKKAKPKEPTILQEVQRNEPPESQTIGNLQDLIRQFEEAQRQAAQGNVEPPVPPLGRDELEDYDEDEVDLPTVRPADPDCVTFREIAESVIQWEEVSVEYLQQAFGFSESTAQQVLADLQAHHIVGHDMGEGFCDPLVHDKAELENLFKREQREAEEQKALQAQEVSLRERREAELKHQQELVELEERTRQAREQAVQINDGSTELSTPCLASADHKAHSRTFNKAEIRRGFVWAKVLDDPRFKKKWNARVR